ncbi:MAG: hypothetical protein JXR89_02775, partial [Deltaproteobacteria bacterium]|nr:hypothetical protein [Deltaproteobacteria bacterium]
AGHSWQSSAGRAFCDLLRPRVLLPLALTSAAIIYFTQPGATGSGVLLLRAALVTWLGFMLIHRVNPLALVNYLRRRGSHQFAATLDYSLAVWQAGEKEQGK